MPTFMRTQREINPNYANITRCHYEERSNEAISSLKKRFLASLGMTTVRLFTYTLAYFGLN